MFAFSDDKATTDFRILNLDGEIQHQQFIDGRVQSMAVSPSGEVYMTKQVGPNEDCETSTIYHTSVDCPLAWEELSSAYDYAFQALCVYDEETLSVATATVPVNIYSKWVGDI